MKTKIVNSNNVFDELKLQQIIDILNEKKQSCNIAGKKYVLISKKTFDECIQGINVIFWEGKI